MNGATADERAELRSRQRPTETVAGLLAAASIAMSAIGLTYRPVRIIPFAIFFALLAAAFGGRYSRLALAATITGAVCFVVGMALAVWTRNPIF
jgi:hypothetical protein